MLRQRVLVTAVLLPVGLVLIYFGGYPFFIFIALILTQAQRRSGLVLVAKRPKLAEARRLETAYKCLLSRKLPYRMVS